MGFSQWAGLRDLVIKVQLKIRGLIKAGGHSYII